MTEMRNLNTYIKYRPILHDFIVYIFVHWKIWARYSIPNSLYGLSNVFATFVIDCKELKIAEIAYINQLSQLLNLISAYGYSESLFY